MYLSAFTLFFKDLIRRKEFFFTLTFSFLVVLVPLAGDLKTFYQADCMYHFPAWYLWGTKGLGYSLGVDGGNMQNSTYTISTFLTFLIPFVGSLAYSYCHFDHERFRILNQLKPRLRHSAYYHGAATVVFIGAFAVVFLPLLLEQLILCIAVPSSVNANIGSTLLLDDYASSLLHLPAGLQPFQIQHPYLFNVLFCAIPAFSASVIACCSYTLSLYFHKSRFLIITLPGILLWLMIPFAFSNASGSAPLRAFTEVFPGGDLFWWGISNIVLFALCIVGIELKIHWFKDVLG